MKNIVFLPGLMGSKLTNARTGKAVWGGLGQVLFGSVFEMQLNPDGTSKNPIFPSGLDDNAYGRFVKQLRKPGTKVLALPVDWRVDVEDEAMDILDAINQEWGSNSTFTVITHSQGTSHARMLYRKLSNKDRMELAIFVAPPSWGSYNAHAALCGTSDFYFQLAAASGIGIGKQIDRFSEAMKMNGLRLDELDKMISSFDGLLTLLPNRHHFPDAEAMYAEAYWADKNKYVTQDILDRVKNVHNKLANASKEIPDSKMKTISGIGTATMSGIKNRNLDFRSILLNPLVYDRDDGDGRVVASQTKIFANSEEQKFFSFNHSAAMNDAKVQAQINMWLGSALPLDDVTDTATIKGTPLYMRVPTFFVPSSQPPPIVPPVPFPPSCPMQANPLKYAGIVPNFVLPTTNLKPVSPPVPPPGIATVVPRR